MLATTRLHALKAIAARVLGPWVDEVDAASVRADALAGVLGGLSVGDPMDPANMIGPLVAARQRDRVEGYIAIGKQEGATIAAGGGRPAGLDSGWYVQPTLFVDVDNSMRIAREEIFGPVLSILPFADEEDAIRIANDSSFGLGGAVYGADTAKALAVAKRLRTGQVNVNGAVNLVPAPFGGFKESGIGREGGRWGLDEYTEIQAVAWK